MKKRFNIMSGEDMRKLCKDLSIVIGCAILFFVFSMLAVSVFSLMFHLRLTAFPFLFACLASPVFIWICVRQLFKEGRLPLFGIFCAIVGTLIWNIIFLSGAIYDVSCDGQFYHQEAVIQLAQGWNPIYEELSCPGQASQYINPYTKASWINAAALYKATGHIEGGKAFNLLLIFASFFLFLAACLSLRRIRADVAFILSFLVVLNPVSSCQIFTYYIDSQLASLIIALAAVTCLVFTRPGRLIDFALLMIVSYAINVKLTALPYLFVYIVWVFLSLFFTHRKELALKFAGIFFSGFLVGVFVFGYNPFVTNTLKTGNPFYVIAGSEKVDLMENQRPIGFDDKTYFERLCYSLFSCVANQESKGRGPVLKCPFMFYQKELKGYAWPDLRIGGFGPLFGGALVLSLLMILMALVLRLPAAGIMASASLLVIASVLINPESWWARYVPQLWLIPFILIIFSLYAQKKIMYFLGKLLYFVIFANVFLVLVSSLFYKDYADFSVKKQLAYISTWPQPVFVKFFLFCSDRVRLQEYGIKYIEVEKMPCRRPLNLMEVGGRRTQVCPGDSG